MLWDNSYSAPNSNETVHALIVFTGPCKELSPGASSAAMDKEDTALLHTETTRDEASTSIEQLKQQQQWQQGDTIISDTPTANGIGDQDVNSAASGMDITGAEQTDPEEEPIQGVDMESIYVDWNMWNQMHLGLMNRVRR